MSCNKPILLMAIKTDSQRKERLIDGKPAAQWFQDAAQEHKQDNQFATYDRPGSKPAVSKSTEVVTAPKKEPEPKPHAVVYKAPAKANDTSRSSSIRRSATAINNASGKTATVLANARRAAHDAMIKSGTSKTAYSTPKREIKVDLPPESEETDAFGEPKTTAGSIYRNRYGT